MLSTGPVRVRGGRAVQCLLLPVYGEDEWDVESDCDTGTRHTEEVDGGETKIREGQDHINYDAAASEVAGIFADAEKGEAIVEYESAAQQRELGLRPGPEIGVTMGDDGDEEDVASVSADEEGSESAGDAWAGSILRACVLAARQLPMPSPRRPRGLSNRLHKR